VVENKPPNYVSSINVFEDFSHIYDLLVNLRKNVRAALGDFQICEMIYIHMIEVCVVKPGLDSRFIS
jgi:hypothetical protein